MNANEIFKDCTPESRLENMHAHSTSAFESFAPAGISVSAGVVKYSEYTSRFQCILHTNVMQ